MKDSLPKPEADLKMSKAQELYNYIEMVTLGTIHQHSPHTQDLLRYLKKESTKEYEDRIRIY